MAKKAGKTNRVNEIVGLLESGLERKDIVQKLTKTYKLSARTIDAEIKEAKSVVSERNKQKEAIRQERVSAELREAINEAVISDLEIEAILCKIVTGHMQIEEIVKGEPILRGVTPSEITQAAKVLYQKRGSYATTKIDVTTEGKAINTPAAIISFDGKSIEIVS